MVLGSYLRRLREARGMAVERAAEVIRCSPSKISRIELGKVSFKRRDLADLLTLYGVVDADERAVLVKLAEEAKQPGWWHRYNEVLPRWLDAYLGLEGAASVIRSYEAQFVPSLLQTKEYTRAVIRQAHPDDGEGEIEARLGMRVARQEYLSSNLTLWAVVDEAAMRRLTGGREVMRGQLAHLMEVIDRPNITVQIVPFSVGAHAGGGGSFTILRFEEFVLPDVVFIEHLDSAVYLDKPAETNRYMRIMDRLCVQAAAPDQSRKLLDQIHAVI
jgi:transcriptional regulator with XRE-family HTH domain